MVMTNFRAEDMPGANKPQTKTNKPKAKAQPKPKVEVVAPVAIEAEPIVEVEDTSATTD